jgi:hypothetical protein
MMRILDGVPYADIVSETELTTDSLRYDSESRVRSLIEEGVPSLRGIEISQLRKPLISRDPFQVILISSMPLHAANCVIFWICIRLVVTGVRSVDVLASAPSPIH